MAAVALVELAAELLGQQRHVPPVLGPVGDLRGAAVDGELPVEVDPVEAASKPVEEQLEARRGERAAGGGGERGVGEPAGTPPADGDQRAQVRVSTLERRERGEVGGRVVAHHALAVLDGGERVEQVGDAVGRDLRDRIVRAVPARVVGPDDRAGLLGTGLPGTADGGGE
jgi:hypothetical protein